MSLYGFQHVQFNQGQLQRKIEKESKSFMQPQYEYEIALPMLKKRIHSQLLLKTKVIWVKKSSEYIAFR